MMKMMNNAKMKKGLGAGLLSLCLMTAASGAAFAVEAPAKSEPVTAAKLVSIADGTAMDIQAIPASAGTVKIQTMEKIDAADRKMVPLTKIGGNTKMAVIDVEGGGTSDMEMISVTLNDKAFRPGAAACPAGKPGFAIFGLL